MGADGIYFLCSSETPWFKPVDRLASDTVKTRVLDKEVPFWFRNIHISVFTPKIRKKTILGTFKAFPMEQKC